MHIKASRLYRKTVNHTGIDKRRYARELRRAILALPRTDHRFARRSPDVLCAFVWIDTPQGMDFWNKVDNSINRSKYNRDWS